MRRLRGELFALLTLAVTFVLATIVLNTRIDGGPGVYLSAVPLPRLGGSPTATLYLLALGIALVTVATAYAVYHARWGAGLFAIHDDEDVAEVLGVPTYRYKLLALGLSAGLAGVAGGIHAMFVTYVTVAETFSIVVPLYVVLMSVLGGARHWLGPAIGAALVTALMYGVTGGQTAVAGRAAVGLDADARRSSFCPSGITGFVQPATTGARGAPAPRREAAERCPRSPTAPPARRRVAAARAAPTCGRRSAASRRWAGSASRSGKGRSWGSSAPTAPGKSTLINVVSGHHRADGGRIVLGGVDVDRSPGAPDRPAGRVAHLPDPAPVRPPDRPRQRRGRGHVRPARTGPARRRARGGPLAGVHGPRGPRARCFPAALNLHQRKFLELARALASEPRLVLLDEVLSGLTPTEMADATRLVRDIRDRGTTVVFVEHIMRAVMALADRVVVLDAGQVIAGGLPADVMRHPDVVRRYLGKAHA